MRSVGSLLRGWLQSGFVFLAFGILTIGTAGEAVAQGGAGRAGSGKSVTKGKPRETPKDLIAADEFTLRDGKVLRGQVVDQPQRGFVVVIVRRAWAKEHMGDWSGRWEKAAEGPAREAAARRRDRLKIWRAERHGPAADADKIDAWIDRELAADAGRTAQTPLMVVRLERGEIKTIGRRGPLAGRALRMGWACGFADAETIPLADLVGSLAGRGLDPTPEAFVPIDDLLPVPSESEGEWRVRRAATEVAHDSGLRFIRPGNMVLPEPAPGAGPGAISVDPAAAGKMLAEVIGELSGGPTSDPLVARLKEVGDRGRVGAVVTRLDLGANFDSVSVEAGLYVRGPDGSWSRPIWRSGSIRAGDPAIGGGDDLAEDPQVKAAFGLVESLGLGSVSPEMKAKGLAVGAATRRALGMARTALNAALAPIALPVAEPTSGKEKR